MRVTTIKLQYKTKGQLDRLKGKQESYDAIIRKLTEEKLRERLLIDACKRSAAFDRKMAKELEGTLGDGL